VFPVELEDSDWHAFLVCAPHATPFHHPAWSTVLAETYGFRPFALVHREPGGRISEGLPVVEIAPPFGRPRWVALPFTDYCPPLALGPTLRDDFVADLDALRCGAAVARLEVRAPLAAHDVQLQERAIRHVLPLTTDSEELLQSVCSHHVRRNVRKAIREGVAVRTAETESDLVDVFYRLHLMTRRRLGVPVQPRQYFRLLWRLVIEPGLGRLLLAYRGTDAIGGMIALAWNGTAIYKYGAWDERARELRPNHLLLWNAIQYAIEEGATTFDLGRTDRDQRGLREYKTSWGAREDPLAYSILGAASGVSALSSPALVSCAIRHSPRLLCRALGETFYRFAA
jgi:CelD/BcsL family acetyltransferase involved in cellulose biosynthesis